MAASSAPSNNICFKVRVLGGYFEGGIRERDLGGGMKLTVGSPVSHFIHCSMKKFEDTGLA